ncbi:MAG: SHOCT domain-containing protein [Dehalococcoidia bacterium]|nr:MAG: SHOCT domain-containing protein [Dehalococcoidia bacterium]
MWYEWNEGLGLWMIFGGLFSLAFLIGLIFLIIWAVKQINLRSSSSNTNDSALDIARQRYARGEITLQEFEEIKRNLSLY